VFEDYVVLRVDSISIVGRIFLPDKSHRYPLVCLCHGVPSGSPPDPNDGGYPALAERICRENYAVFIFNFRGTGDSGGNLDLLGWTRDLQAAIDYIYEVQNVDPSRLFLVGFSGGAATSVYVASKDRRVSGVAACACPAHFGLLMERDAPQATIEHYRSIGAIRDNDFPPSVEGWFDDLKRITPIDHVAAIAPRPLLLVHGDRDETVPVDHAYALFEKAGEPKRLVVLEKAGHRLRHEEKAIAAVLEWLGSLRRDGGGTN
jgi:dipeptidyl aminopeptidase/acylaminoacyl peptidase